MKKSNVCKSPIARDNLFITDTEYGVKLIFPNLLLECSIQELHNQLIASPAYGGLIGTINDDTNDVISSDTMLRSLEPPQLLPMTYHQKIMYGCAIFNTSKYFQESLYAWQRKQLKTMKYKAENSRGRKKDELTQAYKSYDDHNFTNNETCHPR